MSQIQHGREGNEPPADPLSPIAFPDDFYDAPPPPVEPAARPLSPPPPVEERVEGHELMVEMERTLDTLLLRPPSPPEENPPSPTPGRVPAGIHSHDVAGDHLERSLRSGLGMLGMHVAAVQANCQRRTRTARFPARTPPAPR